MKRQQKRICFTIQFWLPFILMLISCGPCITEDIGDDVSLASMVTSIFPSKTLPSTEAEPTFTEEHLQENVDQSSVLLSPSSTAAAEDLSSITTQTQQAISSTTPELETSYVESISEQQRTNQTSELTLLETMSTVSIEPSHNPIPSETQEVSVLEKPVTEQTIQSEMPPIESSPVSQTSSDIRADITWSQSDEGSITQSALPVEPSGVHGKVLLDEKIIILQEIAEPLKTGEEPVTSGADKPEDFPSFNEWLAEQEKTKHDAKPEGDKKHLKQGRRGNYASRECGAKILANNPEAVNSKSMLNSNKDEYMINPCRAKKWFDLELCEPIQFQSVEIASLEMFSSQPKAFKLYISDRYPAKDWKYVGDFHMSEARGPQNFPVTGIDEFYAKFVRVELLEHYGDEHFCPITFFRVYGIAVYEDDDDDVETQRPTTEEEEEGYVTGEFAGQEEDAGVNMKNLLASAKDTVINIVKKVLKVDEGQKEEAYRNGTEGFVADHKNEMHNVSSSMNDTSHMLPCVLEVRISGSNVSMENESVKQGEPQPQPPHAFIPEGSKKQDTKLPIVTKLEDNEQIPSETIEIPATSDQVMLGLNLSHAVPQCFSCDEADVLELSRQATLTKLCAYIVLLLGKHLAKSCKQVDDSTKFDFILIESSIQSETMATIQTGSLSESEASVIIPVEVKPLTQSDSTLTTSIPSKIEELSTVAVTGISTVEFVKPSLSESVEDTIKTEAQISETQVFNTISSIPTSSVSFSNEIKESTMQISSSAVVSESFTETTSSQASETLSTSTSESVFDTPLVEPSTTGLPINLDSSLESTVLKTPSLSDVKDTLKPDTDIVDSSVQESLVSKQTEQVRDEKPLPEVTSPVIQPTEPITPTISIALEPTHLDLPSVPSAESPAHSSPVSEKSKMNMTEIPTGPEPDQKAAMDLDLVKVPIMPISKRESAIMRLSNRIKVLEQNVTLSSLFLDALSKRFRKQSEEMMKTLNKTVAKLNNVTMLSAAKDQMQEERIQVLEEEIRNLTKTVNYLTNDLDTLNQQVKDRQVVWSIIEIIIVVVILVLTNRRGKKLNFSPEIQKLIDSMPTKPLPPTPHRRNSYSGPITPSKHKDKLTGTLQKYRSETALAASDFPIVEPLFSSSTQIKEGQKRKKKKKQRSMDFRFSAFWTEDRPLIEGQEWQSRPEYYRRDSDQSSSRSSRSGEPNVLSGYCNRNLGQTNFSLSGHKKLPGPPSNPNVQLRESKTSPDLQSGFNSTSCECKQQSKSASHLRRNSHDLQNMKMKDIPGPPVTSKVSTQIIVNPSNLGQRKHGKIQSQSDSKNQNSQGHGSEVKQLSDSHYHGYYDSHVNGIQNIPVNGCVNGGEVCNQSQYYNNSKGKFSPYPMGITAQNGYSDTDLNGFHGKGLDIHDYILDDLCNAAHSSEKEIINASKEKSVSTGIWKKVFG